jgi:hypothetical protein
MSNLSKFYEVLNTVELSSADSKKLSDAAFELANAEMKKGNKIATDIFCK